MLSRPAVPLRVHLSQRVAGMSSGYEHRIPSPHASALQRTGAHPFADVLLRPAGWLGSDCDPWQRVAGASRRSTLPDQRRRLRPYPSFFVCLRASAPLCRLSFAHAQLPRSGRQPDRTGRCVISHRPTSHKLGGNLSQLLTNSVTDPSPRKLKSCQVAQPCCPPPRNFPPEESAHQGCWHLLNTSISPPFPQPASLTSFPPFPYDAPLIRQPAIAVRTGRGAAE